MKNTKQQRKLRISSKVRGRADRPRLSVFRSNTAMYVQLIDDSKGVTLVGVAVKKKETSGTKTVKAKELGKQLAAAANEKKINRVVFDKGLYKYHGRIKSFAEGAREGGLKF